MDSITQAMLGASIGGAMLGRWHGRKALVAGALLGTLPDMDVVINYGDAVANMTYHRGFSHSLFVLTALSLLLAWGWRRWRPNPGYSGVRLGLCIWLILATHVLLDAFTSYGTQLFWPLTTPPVSISSIFIIDPLYSVPLLLAVITGLIIGLKGKGRTLQYAALMISTLYLASTLVGKQMAESNLQLALARDDIQPQAVFITPTPFNTVLWRVVAVDGDNYYEGLVSWFDDEPPALERLPRQYSAAAPALQGSAQHERLRWFTGDILRYDLIDNQWVVTDLRLGMTGYHPFRFALAKVEPQDQSAQLIEYVEQWPAGPRGLSRLSDLRKRALDSSYRLSLRELTKDLGRSPLQLAESGPGS
ncbi:metal-dependent hydrolase [Halopseudomonas pelagia]|uniref:metal-dependent hydrolase n=1 Tax=Halopseudomonas pelagia TaxID=553151 RepID=UPI000399E67D|nr:metal-dependent hydrolase [Halopseudomonas pelagia]|tara:strand:+ start:956 stop:2038 length:1083 start_codon:yes stop_codon:yes gene_type:complete